MGGPTYSVTAHAKDIYHRQVRLDRLRDKLAAAAFVATVSRANCEYLDALLAGRARLHVVPNAVDLRRLDRVGERPRERNLVLSVARLIEKKGLQDLVRASGLLAERGVRHRLLVVGDGPLRNALEETAAQVGSPATFPGVMPHEEILDLYRRAEAFCLPSVVASTGDRDGLPTSVLEAMALGVPVVTTGVNGLGELVVHERTGLVVPERDPIALAAALHRLLVDRSLAGHLASEGRVLVERSFSLEQSVSALRSLLSEAA
jgi:glycosyltransferase involved in cell wall biosynthesis